MHQNNSPLDYQYLSDHLTRMAQLQSEVVPLKSILLNRTVFIAGKPKLFVRPGDWIKINNGQIVDCIANPTHEIKECRGTILNKSLAIIVMDLHTGQESIVKLSKEPEDA